MSAIVDGPEGPAPTVQVLLALHPGFDLLDIAGAMEVLGAARHDMNDPKTGAFECSIVAAAEHTVSAQGASVRAHMDFEDAHEALEEYDVVIIPGGSEGAVLEKSLEPLDLIKAYAALQLKNPSKERTLMAVSGGALFLGQQGVLQGLGATTRPDLFTKFEIICQNAARRGDLEQTETFEERYVVNNARFALGDNEDENPFIFRQRPDGRRKSAARKGSNAWKESNRRRESILQRSQMRLGGLRVITSSGGTAALDSALYLVSAMVSHDSAEAVARLLQYTWSKGVVVDSIDV